MGIDLAISNLTDVLVDHTHFQYLSSVEKLHPELSGEKPALSYPFLGRF